MAHRDLVYLRIWDSRMVLGAYSSGMSLDRSIGVTAGVLAFFALVLRIPAKREGAIVRGESPEHPPILLPRQTWLPSWFIKSPNGWDRLDRVLIIIAIAGAAVFVTTLALVPALKH
jgi:hypothetical protein